MNLRSRCVFEVGFEAKRNGQINGAWRKLSSPLRSCQSAQSAGSWTTFEKHVSQLNAFPRVCFLLALAYVNCIWVRPPVFLAAKGSMLIQVSPRAELRASMPPEHAALVHTPSVASSCHPVLVKILHWCLYKPLKGWVDRHPTMQTLAMRMLCCSVHHTEVPVSTEYIISIACKYLLVGISVDQLNGWIAFYG